MLVLYYFSFIEEKLEINLLKTHNNKKPDQPLQNGIG